MARTADEALRLASDPSTPLALLYELAQQHPEVHPALAANPSTYPDLLAWLGSLGRPEVDAALAARSRGTSTPAPGGPTSSGSVDASAGGPGVGGPGVGGPAADMPAATPAVEPQGTTASGVPVASPLEASSATMAIPLDQMRAAAAPQARPADGAADSEPLPARPGLPNAIPLPSASAPTGVEAGPTVMLPTRRSAAGASGSEPPVVAEPEAVQPETVPPAAAEPAVVEPEVEGPAAAEPAAVEPEVEGPAAAEPAVVEPEVADPTVTEPVVAEPAAAEPEVTEPTERVTAVDEDALGSTQAMPPVTGSPDESPAPAGRPPLPWLAQSMALGGAAASPSPAHAPAALTPAATPPEGPTAPTPPAAQSAAEATPPPAVTPAAEATPGPAHHSGPTQHTQPMHPPANAAPTVVAGAGAAVVPPVAAPPSGPGPQYTQGGPAHYGQPMPDANQRFAPGAPPQRTSVYAPGARPTSAAPHQTPNRTSVYGPGQQPSAPSVPPPAWQPGAAAPGYGGPGYGGPGGGGPTGGPYGGTQPPAKKQGGIPAVAWLGIGAVVALLVIAGIWFISQLMGGGDEPTAGPTPTPSATVTVAPTEVEPTTEPTTPEATTPPATDLTAAGTALANAVTNSQCTDPSSDAGALVAYQASATEAGLAGTDEAMGATRNALTTLQGRCNARYASNIAADATALDASLSYLTSNDWMTAVPNGLEVEPQALGAFATPSGNIVCEVGAGGAVCTINAYDFTPPPGCAAGSPVTFVVDTEGSRADCQASAGNGGGNVLQYGSATQMGDFICTSAESGVTCWDSLSGATLSVARALGTTTPPVHGNVGAPAG